MTGAAVQTQQLSLKDFIGREDFSLNKGANGDYTLEWRPAGPGAAKDAYVAFRFLSPVPDVRQIMDIMHSVSQNLDKEGHVQAHFLSAPGVQELLNHATICVLKDYEAKDETLLFSGVPKLSLQNVVFSNCNISLKGDSVTQDNVTFSECRICIEATDGHMSGVTIDKNSTTSGSLGNTFIDKNCRIAGMAASLDAKTAEAESTDVFQEGLVFRLSLFPDTLIPQTSRKELSRAEYLDRCSQRNNLFTGQHFYDVLVAPPFSANAVTLQTPIDPAFANAGLTETAKLELAVVTGGSLGNPSLDHYLTEYDKAGRISFFKGSIAAAAGGAVSNPSMKLIARCDNYEEAVCDALKLLATKARLKPAINQPKTKKITFSWDASAVDKGSFGDTFDDGSSGGAVPGNASNSGVAVLTKP